jgi:stage III sporulation protein AA
VVDERGELFPDAGGFVTGPRTDVLRGCSKKEGIEILLRTMGPGAIAVDEITSEQDCIELLRAGWCGVDLLATAHAASKTDLHARPIYRALVKNELFDHLVILQSDKSCITERMGL